MVSNNNAWPSVASATVWAPLQLTLGESLLLDTKQNRLFFQDIMEHYLYEVDLEKDPDCKNPRKVALADNLGMIALIEGDSDHLIAAAKRGVALVSIKTGELQYLCRYNELSEEAGYRANDGCIDPRGRLWSGTHAEFVGNEGVGMDDTPADGFLFRFDPDGTLHRILEGVAAPNGMNFSSDFKTFYVIDSFHYCIYAYDYDLERGAISNERQLIKFDRSLGVPDGAHIDVQDIITVAMAFGESNVLRVDPGDRGSHSGKIIGQIDVDNMMTTCVTYGGPDMKDIYITSAGVESMVPGIKAKDKNWGSLFKTRVDIAGTKRPRFGPLVPGVDRAAKYSPLAPSAYRMGALGGATAE